VLSGRGLCDELITRPEESYQLCCVVVCDLETSIGALCVCVCVCVRARACVRVRACVRARARVCVCGGVLSGRP